MRGGPLACRRRQSRWGTRRTASVGVVALGAAAAAVVVALAVTSTPAPGHNPTASGTPSATATATEATPATVNPLLAQLAADIKVQQVKLPGNATMEIRNQSPTSDKLGDNGVDLYTDSGTYYWALSESMLP